MKDFVCTHLNKLNSKRMARAGREIANMVQRIATPAFDNSPTQDIARGTLTSPEKRSERSMCEVAARLFNEAGAALRGGDRERAIELVELSRIAMEESCHAMEKAQR